MKPSIISGPTLTEVRRSDCTRRAFLQTALAGGVSLAGSPYVLARQAGPTEARGIVFHDRDGDGRRGPGDTPVADVAVSNGRLVTRTDEKGQWSLPLEGGGQDIFFVIKPRGWTPPLSQHNLSRFYYIHHPEGSTQRRHRGIDPTGSLPASIDFPLAEQEEGDRFTALLCGDTQPRDEREVGYLAQTVVPELRRSNAAFGVTLGDVMFDDLSLFEPLNEAMAHIGKPWYHLLGNHDLNFDTPDNRHATDTFRRVYGPTWCSFDYGPVHFLVLNNVEWMGQDGDRPNWTGNYRGSLGERQLEFIAEDLKLVPENRLVVLLLHIPLEHPDTGDPSFNTADRHALYRLIERRPHTFSVSAHTHWHGNLLLGRGSGWQGAQPHHHLITGTLCGSWFAGAPGPNGVPHATMTDGTPRGYVEVAFDGNRYNIDGYRAVGHPASHQMHIEAPPQIARHEAGSTLVYVNVFNGSERSTVRMRLAPGGDWLPLEQVREPDPAYVRLRQQEGVLAAPWRNLPNPSPCQHLWRGGLGDVTGGTHLIEVAATDMHGNTHFGSRPIRVTS
jgi:hypothetical protein